MTFSVGDKVRWSSQSQGFTKEKVGMVAQVVAAGQKPDTKFYQLYKGPGVGGYRDHESYVVTVGTRPYWPRANKLEKVGVQGKSKDALVADTYRQVACAVEPELSKLIDLWCSNMLVGFERLREAHAALVAAMRYDNEVMKQG